MKGKVKIKLEEDSVGITLSLYLKLEGELSYNHRKTIVGFGLFHDNDIRTLEEFYDVVHKFISDKNNIIEESEDFMRDILKRKIKELKQQSKEQQVKMLIKQLKQPIEIEIKD